MSAEQREPPAAAEAVMHAELTDLEIELVEKVGQWWNAFCKLPQTHPSDAADVLFHVHALQRIVMARSAQRAHPDRFPEYPK